MLRILIVEDELIIAQDLKNMLESMHYEVVGMAIDQTETIQLIKKEKPDLILLDINLNCSIDGVEIGHIINTLFKLPFIYLTSFSDLSTINRARETNPLNYIVKPFQKEQLFSAIEMSLHKFSINKIEKVEPYNKDTLVIKDTLFIKDRYKYTRLDFNDILWVKSDGNYLEIQTPIKKELVRATLTNFLENLTKDYIRTHKSYAINLNHLTKLDAASVDINGEKIPLSKTYRNELLQRLKIV